MNLAPLKHKLDQDQIEELAFGMANPYVLYRLPMGFGKTALAIALQAQFPSLKVLVVCPAGLKLNWKKEINKFRDNMKITVISKSLDIKKPTDSDFVIVPYSLLQNAECLFEWADIVVADEAHNLKSMDAKRTQKFHQYVYENSIKRLYLMTGTAIKNRVWEIYSLMALCYYNPAAKDTKFLDMYPDHITFADKFSHRVEFEKYIGNKRIKILNWRGLKNVDELKHWLRPISRKRDPKSGPVIINNILISETDNLNLLADFEKVFEGLGDSIMSDVKAEAAAAKVPYTIEYIEGILDEVGKVIIVSDHVEPALRIAAHFKVTPITGSTNSDKRQEIVNDFEDGKTSVLVGTIGTLKEGYNLTSCWNMVLNDFCWVPGDLDQLYARINRRGQTKQCVIHAILGSPQDDTILGRLEEKREVIKRV
jgi:SWI/SNF-related matrix-associated actin-dependent regulator of chromatin subfamily A-like protein 1